MTKEKRKFHVILSSSDSFMQNWLFVAELWGGQEVCISFLSTLAELDQVAIAALGVAESLENITKYLSRFTVWEQQIHLNVNCVVININDNQ